jgi:transcriptional regulator of aromatic amino acid metabolism
MGTVVMDGAELVGTVVAEPGLDTEGLLNLQVVSVKMGAVDITPLARVLARRICQQQFAAANIGAEDMQAQMAASLLDGKPFKPVFKIEDKKVRVEKITIEQKKLTIRLVPVFD